LVATGMFDYHTHLSTVYVFGPSPSGIEAVETAARDIFTNTANQFGTKLYDGILTQRKCTQGCNVSWAVLSNQISYITNKLDELSVLCNKVRFTVNLNQSAALAVITDRHTYETLCGYT